jgi:AcrR family transcriptional regulator
MSNIKPVGLRERKKLEARAAILESAGSMIERFGYDATTMRDVADAAGVSHQTLYNYFPTKAQVVQGLLVADRTAAIDRLNRMMVSELDPMKQLDLVVKFAFDIIGKRRRPLWRQVISVFFGQSNTFFSLLAGSYEAAQERLTALFDTAQRRGTLCKEVDVQVLAEAVYAIVDFAILQYIMEEKTSRATIQKRVRAQLRLLLDPYRYPAVDGNSIGVATGSVQRGP